MTSPEPAWHDAQPTGRPREATEEPTIAKLRCEVYSGKEIMRVAWLPALVRALPGALSLLPLVLVAAEATP